MTRLLFPVLLTVVVLCHHSTTGQNWDRMCRQLQQNCNACAVYRSECTEDNHGNVKPSNQPGVIPSIPDSPNPGPGPVQPVPPNPSPCFVIGKLCDTNDDCCSRNCKVVKINMGPDSYFTQRVCRDK